MKKLTIVEIAKMAGVGTTTVSRYFNGGNLKKETREKIKEIVEKYNYTPNTFAKALKGTDSKIIGVVVPALHSYVTGMTLRYLDNYLKENDYEVLIFNSNFEENAQIKYIERLARMNVDGIILIPTTMSRDYEKMIKSIKVPIVVLGQEGERSYSVEYNDFNSARDITNYVVDKGHTKISYLGVSEEDVAVGIYRKLGVIKTLEKRNLLLTGNFLTTFSLTESYNVVKENINEIKKSSCLICATDRIAYGAIKALEEFGIIVGENFSIVGFGNYDSSSLLRYPLTTIDFDIEDAARKTVEVLLQLIRKENPPIKTLIGYSLKDRKSVVQL